MTKKCVICNFNKILYKFIHTHSHNTYFNEMKIIHVEGQHHRHHQLCSRAEGALCGVGTV